MRRLSRAPLLGVLVLLLGSCSAGDVNEDESGDGGSGRIDGGGGGGVDAGPVAGEPTALMGITAAHNAVRTAHGVVDIVWDNDLAAVAKAWADNCEWGHNDGRSDNYPGYVGENIYGSSAVPTGAQVTGSWASEEENYNYQDNSCDAGKVCGHYTQIVWADSVKLGCAIGYCPNSNLTNFVVCDYSPGGNFTGAKPY